MVISGVILILFFIREFSRRSLFKFQHAHGRITVKSIRRRLLFVLMYVDAADTPTNIRNINDTLKPSSSVPTYIIINYRMRSDSIAVLRENSKTFRLCPKNEFITVRCYYLQSVAEKNWSSIELSEIDIYI